MSASSQRKPARANVWVLAGLISTAGLIAMGGPTAAQSSSNVLFGMDAASVAPLAKMGLKPDLGVLWVGPWTLKHGWSGVDAELVRLKNAGVVPTVHLYYWGNDISRACVNDGCWSTTHDAWKDRAGWDRLTAQLIEHLKAKLGGSRAIVVLETEFNKNDVRTWETLDALLASKAGAIRWGAPGTQVALGFGNWGSHEWSTFDRAAGSSDFVGLQGMRASTRDSRDSYYGLVESLLAGARTAQGLFGKPIMLTDVALSSYPEPGYADHQANVLGNLFAKLPDLKKAGVGILVYRGLRDNPSFNAAEYYGRAEAHWGLMRSDGSAKPALDVWRRGVGGAGDSVAFSRTWEAEALQHRDVGGSHAVASASGGRIWNLWTNGWSGQDVELPSGGTYEVRVVARGSEMDGVWPWMRITVDGRQVTAASVSPSGYRTYTGSIDVANGGWHRVAVHFTNDAMGGGEDRNLLLDKVTLVRR